MSIENNQKNFHSIVRLDSTSFVVRTSNGQSGTEAVLRSKLFLITITDGKMTSKEFYTDPDGTLTQDMIRVSKDRVLLIQSVAGTTGSTPTFALTSVTTSGEIVQLMSADGGTLRVLLTEEPQPVGF